MSRKVINVALTGSRLSGKNGVCKIFKQIGIPVFDADTVLKFILNYKPSVARSVQNAFGKEYTLGSYINPLAFNTDDKFRQLVNLIDFELFEAYDRFRDKHINRQYTIFHSSILFEQSWNYRFDKVICVFSPKEERMERYKNNYPYSSVNLEKKDTLLNIFAKEMSDSKKNQLSSFVISNHQGALDVLEQVTSIDDFIIDHYLNINRSVDMNVNSHYKNITI